jgi:transposase
MSSLAEDFDVVIGVDTHRDTHTYAVLAVLTGAHIHTITVPADPAGFAAAVESISTVTQVDAGRWCWAVEGCGSWGRSLFAWLHASDARVVEIERPKRAHRHMGAKNDDLDAVRAAREALAMQRLPEPKTPGSKDFLAALMTVRNSAVHAATDAERQLHALITTAPELIASRLRGLTTPRIIAVCTGTEWVFADTHTTAYAGVMTALARRVTALRAEADHYKTMITEHVEAVKPELLNIVGVGPIVAATVLCSWGQPGRVRNEAAFAMLAGTAPIPASSGLTTRHRLNRFGDRRLNSAIHTVAVTRLRCDERTKTYANRRRADGKTDRDIRRCLKRYITRELFRILEQTP